MTIPQDSDELKYSVAKSEIYIRDKGLCWICGEFVILQDYHLGHLLDRVNGGSFTYDNLAVMHQKCNLSKPKHMTIEEALRWKLSFSINNYRGLIKDPTYSSIKTNNYEIINTAISKRHWKYRTTKDQLEKARITVVDYFNSNPELLVGEINHSRSSKIKYFSYSLNISVENVRKFLRDANMVKPKKSIKDGSQYKYIVDNLQILVNKYNTQDNKSKFIACKQLGISSYQFDIMLYCIGLKHKVDPKNLHGIDKTMRKLHLLDTTNISAETTKNDSILETAEKLH